MSYEERRQARCRTWADNGRRSRRSAVGNEEAAVKGDVVKTIGFMKEWIREHEDGCEACQYLEVCEARIGAERRLLQLERAQEKEARKAGVIGDGSVAGADEERGRAIQDAVEAGLWIETRREATVDDEGVTVKEEVMATTKEKRAREECYEGYQREMARIQDDEGKIPLAITEWVQTHIQLSTGGPGDGFLLWRTDEGEWVAGEYYYLDWGVRETITLEYAEIDAIVEAYGLAGRGAQAEQPWYEGM